MSPYTNLKPWQSGSSQQKGAIKNARIDQVMIESKTEQTRETHKRIEGEATGSGSANRVVSTTIEIGGSGASRTR